VIGVTRVGFYGAAAMAFSICKNREFYFAISGEPSLQFPVKLVYNKHSRRENVLTVTKYYRNYIYSISSTSEKIAVYLIW
jgi:hypothetical protein